MTVAIYIYGDSDSKITGASELYESKIDSHLHGTHF